MFNKAGDPVSSRYVLAGGSAGSAFTKTSRPFSRAIYWFQSATGSGHGRTRLLKTLCWQGRKYLLISCSIKSSQPIDGGHLPESKSLVERRWGVSFGCYQWLSETVEGTWSGEFLHTNCSRHLRRWVAVFGSGWRLCQSPWRAKSDGGSQTATPQSLAAHQTVQFRISAPHLFSASLDGSLSVSFFRLTSSEVSWSVTTKRRSDWAGRENRVSARCWSFLIQCNSSSI